MSFNLYLADICLIHGLSMLYKQFSSHVAKGNPGAEVSSVIEDCGVVAVWVFQISSRCGCRRQVCSSASGVITILETRMAGVYNELDKSVEKW